MVLQSPPLPAVCSRRLDLIVIVVHSFLPRMCVASSRCRDDLCRVVAWCSTKEHARCMVNGLRASRSAAEAACAFAATCLTASPRSQQELRLKPITLRAQNQRGQLARVQIVVVDRRTPDALRKERPAAPTDLSIRSATRCQQGLSQLRQCL